MNDPTLGRPQCHEVLVTSELLLNIFESTADKRTLAIAAAVCRAWSDLALDVLWKTVEIKHLLQLLSPLKIVNDQCVSVRQSSSYCTSQ